MYKRRIEITKESFFLFGPRGTGKSTWLKSEFKPDIYIDLLRSEEYLSLHQDPSILRAQLSATGSSKKRVVIDEVQRIPDLLNEVHAMIEDFPGRFQFALTGSSARKLRRKESNLLAGRAVTRYFYPLSCSEIDTDFNLEQAISYGTLPKILGIESIQDKVDFLQSYCQTYLREEILQESLVRNLSSYSRFLKHLAIMNGKTLNLSNLSREAGVKRGPLENYISILQDTLMGSLLEPIHLKAKVKEVTTPKFYFFDPGIAQALSDQIGEDDQESKSIAFESLILNEIKVYSNFSRKNLGIYYWGTPSKNEVDFIVTKGKKTIGIEVKYSKKWRPEFTKGLAVLLNEKKIEAGYIIYTGQYAEKRNNCLLLPYPQFCEKLFKGELI